MRGDVEDVSEQYLELVREHLHRFRDALAVFFPGGAPDLVLIELPGAVDYMPVPRRQVTDLLEFERLEEVRRDDQLEFEWPLGDGLDPPPMTRVMNPERKRVLRQKAS
jgi:hypothetical protein